MEDDKPQSQSLSWLEDGRVSKTHGSRGSLIATALVSDEKFEYINYFLMWALFVAIFFALLQFGRQAYNGAKKNKKGSGIEDSRVESNRPSQPKRQEKDDEAPEDVPYKKLSGNNTKKP